MRLQAAVVLLALLASASSVAVRQRLLDISEYSDDIARNKLYPMSAAAYGDDPTKCLANTFGSKNAEIIGTSSVKCDFAGDPCFASTVVSHVDQAIIIAFRGVEDKSELQAIMDDINFTHEKFVGGGKCGKWFIDSFRNIWDAGLKNHYLSARAKYPGYQVWVTGHNVGGSLASVASAYMIYTKVATADSVLLMTMGQPRTGDKDYAHAHDKIVTNSYRIVHNRDLSAHLPVENWEGYYHHGKEVWYDNDMREGQTPKICGDESNKCSDGDWITTNIMDDYYMFNILQRTNEWGKAGCSPDQSGDH
ncbi:hypothetical protein QR680_005924 [Steinernema hermaphroditum]|uniref:Fungal lipase-type domain-containing protein n=1 Tax=Steinernema hermaphroditum TaxID=289476 RepID=A0AA39HVY6_9BILA|nr:hypothetical protein QR680_005924 [Steinernema hermaphroditum]